MDGFGLSRWTLSGDNSGDQEEKQPERSAVALGKKLNFKGRVGSKQISLC